MKVKAQRKKQDNAVYATVAELAEDLGISRTTAYTELRRGSIPHIRMGVRFVIPRAAVQEWLKNAGSSAKEAR
jgi:excisionase family DNA binding protein